MEYPEASGGREAIPEEIREVRAGGAQEIREVRAGGAQEIRDGGAQEIREERAGGARESGGSVGDPESVAEPFVENLEDLWRIRSLWPSLLLRIWRICGGSGVCGRAFC